MFRPPLLRRCLVWLTGEAWDQTVASVSKWLITSLEYTSWNISFPSKMGRTEFSICQHCTFLMWTEAVFKAVQWGWVWSSVLLSLVGTRFLSEAPQALSQPSSLSAEVSSVDVCPPRHLCSSWALPRCALESPVSPSASLRASSSLSTRGASANWRSWLLVWPSQGDLREHQV